MDRRDFLSALPALWALAQFAPRALADTISGIPPEIATLYNNSIVIDSLCAPFNDTDSMPTAELLKAVQQSGITAVNFTVSERTFDGTVQALAYVDALIEQFPEAFLAVRL